MDFVRGHGYGAEVVPGSRMLRFNCIDNNPFFHAVEAPEEISVVQVLSTISHMPQHSAFFLIMSGGYD